MAVTPVQKVIELLNGMEAKGNEEKLEERKAFAKFKTFCDMQGKEKQKLIQAATDKISDLEAQIAKAQAMADELGTDIAGLDSDLATWSNEMNGAKAQRKQEREDYEASHTDYSDSISAIDRAVEVLKSREGDVKQAKGESLVVSTAVLSKLMEQRSLPAPAKQALQSYLQLQSGDAEGEQAPPEANAYEFQSGSVVGLLEKLLLKFEDERRQLDKEEMNMRHAHEQMCQSWTDNIAYAEKTKAEKVAAKEELLAEVAAAKGDMTETQENKKADQMYLQDLTSTCQVKSDEYEKRQKLRDQEIAAIQKAIEIISSPAVAGSADKHLPSAAFLQGARQSALVFSQLRATGSLASDDSWNAASAQVAAAAFLVKQAKKTASSLLTTLAGHASSDPFDKVTRMIKDLIVRLQEEANAEADHKEWCDKEVSENKESRDTLSAEVESLSAKEEELSALEVTLAAEAKELAEAIADIDKAIKEATEDRAEERAKNEATIADANGGKAAVTQALEILKKFYAKASEATALFQRQHQGQVPEGDLPSTWDASYTGMQSETGGVMGMLEVIQSDFARLEAETSYDEDKAKRNHEKFLEDSEVDKATKDRTMRHKGYKRESTLRILRETKKDLDSSQEMLAAALKYYEKLKPSCIDSGLSYKERVQQREEEIQSLKEALKILEGENLSPAL